MKEATGELNMTVVTLIAIAAIGALFYAFIWPMVQRTIVQQTCKTYGPDYVATKGAASGEDCILVDDTTTESAAGTNTDSSAKVELWSCCLKKEQQAATGG